MDYLQYHIKEVLFSCRQLSCWNVFFYFYFKQKKRVIYLGNIKNWWKSDLKINTKIDLKMLLF